MSSKPLALALALTALFFAILLPPEAFPDGKLAVILCSTFAFLGSLSERRITSAYLLTGLLVFGFLLFHSLFVSVDAYRSIEFTSLLWAYYALMGTMMFSKTDPFRPVAVSFVILCAVVSGYGLYQYFFGFERLHQFVSYSSSAEVFKAPALELISRGRVFSTLSLPGTLWGFLVLALPFHAALWGQRKLIRTGLALALALLLITGLLTRSFGFLIGLTVLASVWAALRRRNVALNRLLVVAAVLVVVLAFVGGMFYSARQGTIADANPLVLRVKNWISAWAIFAAHPWGTGLNTYGVVYPRYMMPGGNETQYAHNTALQLLSELGIPVLLTGAAALLLLARRRREIGTDDSRARQRYFMVLALSVWVLHNAIDIDIYFPSLGIAGMILIGTYFWKPSSVAAAPSRGLVAAVSTFATATLIFAGLSMVSSELQLRAKGEFEENRFQEAAATLENARLLMPINSSIFHDLGEVYLNLHQRKKKPEYLEQSTASFREAIALSPLKSGAHTGLGLALASANRVDDAMAEVHEAQRLYPDNTYTKAITKLLQKRIAGTPSASLAAPEPPATDH